MSRHCKSLVVLGCLAMLLVTEGSCAWMKRHLGRGEKQTQETPKPAKPKKEAEAPRPVLGPEYAKMQEQRQYKTEVENQYREQIFGLLRKAFNLGEDDAQVMVSADIDFEPQAVEKVVYDPTNRVAKSVEPTSGASAESASPQEYEYGREITRTTISRGRISRLSASVTIDANRLSQELRPQVESLRKDLEAVVFEGIGCKPERGDSVQVRIFPFMRR